MPKLVSRTTKKGLQSLTAIQSIDACLIRKNRGYMKVLARKKSICQNDHK